MGAKANRLSQAQASAPSQTPAPPAASEPSEPTSASQASKNLANGRAGHRAPQPKSNATQPHATASKGKTQSLRNQTLTNSPANLLQDTLATLQSALQALGHQQAISLCNKAVEYAKALISGNAPKDSTPTSTPSATAIRSIVAEEVTKALRAIQGPKPRSYAEAAAAAVAVSTATTPTTFSAPAPSKVIPSRSLREVIIRGASLSADIKARKPADTLQAIQMAAGRPGPYAVRKLNSGDVALVFQDEATKAIFEFTRANWLQKAFGPTAEMATKTYQVLVKGVHRKDLQGLTEAEWLKQVTLQTPEKAKFRIPTDPKLTRATILVAVRSVAEAQRLCLQGLVWNYQHYNCEPYYSALQPTQCFKCWQWGHTQAFCKKAPLCPHCGTGAHGPGGKEGEAQCPTLKGQRPSHCCACGGKHSARVKDCPERLKAKAQAREAYAFRPRSFDLPTTTTATVATETFTSVPTNNAPVSKKRRFNGNSGVDELAEAAFADIPSSLSSSNNQSNKQ